MRDMKLCFKALLCLGLLAALPLVTGCDPESSADGGDGDSDSDSDSDSDTDSDSDSDSDCPAFDGWGGTSGMNEGSPVGNWTFNGTRDLDGDGLIGADEQTGGTFTFDDIRCSGGTSVVYMLSDID